MTSIVSIPGTQQMAPQAERPSATKATLLHEFFEHAARRWPERTAIDAPPASGRPERRLITYAELNRQADALAHRLSELVTQEECIVAILLPRESEHLYLAQLAVLKAGAAYTCIDPAFPDGQVRNILDDAQAVAVLTNEKGLARVRQLKPDVNDVLNVIEWQKRLRGYRPAPATPPWLSPSSLAYLIYTSGTTGQPKGVMIEHRSIVNLVHGDLQTLGVTPQDRVGQNSSPAYDSSVEETWFALAAGATLVVMDDETTRLGPDLVPWLRRERLTMFCPPPTLLRTTGCEDPEGELPDLRLLHVGGEALTHDVAERWGRGRCLVNDYGPTETTVTSLRGQIEPGDPITIGRPVPGMRAWVLNATLAEVPDGELGELCIGGVGLARGYRNSPELTAQKFPLHPRLGRIYRTGDLVRRELDGTYSFHGRIDSQVKIRGYRIELEAIESRLTECVGIREAACGVQGEGAQQRLVAFIVSEEGANPPAFEDLKNYLAKVLPAYMVPCRFGVLDRLPTSVSGKLNRKALPILEAHGFDGNGALVSPRNPMEEKVALAFRQTLRMNDAVSVEQDFFQDLGGDSLLAAGLISLLRDDPATASLTVRDLYETRTVAGLAARARSTAPAQPAAVAEAPAPPPGHPVLATLAQTLCLLVKLMLGAPLAYLLVFHVLPQLTHSLGLVPLLLLSPVFYFAGLFAYTGLTVALAVFVKKLLIGRYRPLRAPVWGSFYVRNWIVQHAVRLVPWRLLEGTMFQHLVLRALGARIGRRVHIHRGVNLLQGGWDLLDIGDDVTVSQDAALRLVELEDGQIVVGPITLENGSTLEVRAGVAGDTHLETDAYLTALSFLPRGGRIPRGERWAGILAKPAGQAPPQPPLPEGQQELSPGKHGVMLLLARVALGCFVALPLEALALALALALGADLTGGADALFDTLLESSAFLLGATFIILSVPLMLVFQALAMRLVGRVRPGVISRWSPAYVRVWLKGGVVESASAWLSGTLLWPVWLRCAGMRIGRGCEISSIIDIVPELIEIGSETFFADGIYLGGPVVHRGTVTLAPVRLGKNTFLGNHVVIGAGQQLPDDILLGVCTAADDKVIRPGTSWFGHPPFELPNREVVECDRSLTHDPSLIRYINRVFWELLRFALPLAPVLLLLVWFHLLVRAEATVSFGVLLLVVVPLLHFGAVAAMCLLVLVLKWFLLQRVRPGQHPLWSCWCSRWDFLYVAWDFYARTPLLALEGTLWLNWYLRAMGMRIGRNVVLGSGFAHVVDPDMLEFEDGVTVSCLFQAHTFEDRVLKIDRVKIRRGATVGNSAVLLYGADIGARTYVTPHSVVMKRERLLAGRAYGGCPTHLLS
ncbi:MAG TPA: amino acid adenylation domain-containing protein [Gemmataceae bacterium]|nr:amino acid adenylation domain-containing protein [Gemmataceae bacterium]